MPEHLGQLAHSENTAEKRDGQTHWHEKECVTACRDQQEDQKACEGTQKKGLEAQD